MIHHPLQLSIDSTSEKVVNPETGEAHFFGHLCKVEIHLGEMTATLATGPDKEKAIDFSIERLARAIEWLKKERGEG